MMFLDEKITCPKCNHEGMMANFRPSAEVFEIAKIAANFGRAWPWVAEYLHCFRSAPDRPLKASRLKLLLGEIASMVEKGGFPYDGQFYGVRSDALFAACREVALTNKTGFKNHNYLKRVAIGKNQALIEAEEKDQHNRERRAQERTYRDPNAAMKLKEIMGQIG